MTKIKLITLIITFFLTQPVLADKYIVQPDDTWDTISQFTGNSVVVLIAMNGEKLESGSTIRWISPVDLNTANSGCSYELRSIHGGTAWYRAATDCYHIRKYHIALAETGNGIHFDKLFGYVERHIKRLDEANEASSITVVPSEKLQGEQIGYRL